MVLLEVVDGGEGKLVRVHQEVAGFEEEVCNRCKEESREEGSGWLATPDGCRLLAQVNNRFEEKRIREVFKQICF